MNTQNTLNVIAQPDPAPGQSRYGWLASGLRGRILQGEWAPGTALPAETALAQQYGVALGTMRQAIALLVADGLLERQHGKGTFVRNGLGGASMLRFFRFRAASGELPGTPVSTILSREVRLASMDEADHFRLPVGASVLHLKRLRSLDGTPCLLEAITLPLPAFDALVASRTEAWDHLLYPMYQRVCGVTIHRAQDEVSFDLLDATQAQALNLTAGHPCARVCRTAYDLAGQCVELRTTLGDAFAFHYTAQVR